VVGESREGLLERGRGDVLERRGDHAVAAWSGSAARPVES
jgi:hypothetical protein